jgi:hypothetical protein
MISLTIRGLVSISYVSNGFNYDRPRTEILTKLPGILMVSDNSGNSRLQRSGSFGVRKPFTGVFRDLAQAE